MSDLWQQIEFLLITLISSPFHNYQTVWEYLSGQHFDWLDTSFCRIVSFFVIKVMEWLLFYANVTISMVCPY